MGKGDPSGGHMKGAPPPAQAQAAPALPPVRFLHSLEATGWAPGLGDGAGRAEPGGRPPSESKVLYQHIRAFPQSLSLVGLRSRIRPATTERGVPGHGVQQTTKLLTVSGVFSPLPGSLPPSSPEPAPRQLPRAVRPTGGSQAWHKSPSVLGFQGATRDRGHTADCQALYRVHGAQDGSVALQPAGHTVSQAKAGGGDGTSDPPM